MEIMHQSYREKHQITLAGGQIVPLYLGVVERPPDVLHVFYTQETEKVYKILSNILKTISVRGHLVDGFNYSSTYTTIKQLVEHCSTISWELNVTGGTKIMALAAHEYFITKNLPVFYIRQDNSLYDFKSKDSIPIVYEIPIRMFLALSGYTYTGTNITDIPRQDYEIARFISKITSTKQFSVLIKRYQMQFDGRLIDHDFIFSESKQRAEWNKADKMLSIRLLPHDKDVVIKSENALKIAFLGGWWELLVLDAMRKCAEIREICYQAFIQSYENPEHPMNEIDILVSLGYRLVFIECKSGYIKQEDINKMYAVRENYGGSIAFSLLVSRYALEKEIEEKCKKLHIDYLVLSKRKIESYIMKKEIGAYFKNVIKRSIT